MKYEEDFLFWLQSIAESLEKLVAMQEEYMEIMYIIESHLEGDENASESQV